MAVQEAMLYKPLTDLALSVLTQSLPEWPWTRYYPKLKLSWNNLQIVKASSIAISPIVTCTSMVSVWITGVARAVAKQNVQGYPSGSRTSSAIICHQLASCKEQPQWKKGVYEP